MTMATRTTIRYLFSPLIIVPANFAYFPSSWKEKEGSNNIHCCAMQPECIVSITKKFYNNSNPRRRRCWLMMIIKVNKFCWSILCSFIAGIRVTSRYSKEGLAIRKDERRGNLSTKIHAYLNIPFWYRMYGLLWTYKKQFRHVSIFCVIDAGT